MKLVLQQIEMQLEFGSSWFAALPSFSDMMLLAKSERRATLLDLNTDFTFDSNLPFMSMKDFRL